MLVVNKVAIFLVPAPSTVLLVQCVATTAMVFVASAAGAIEVDGLEAGKARRFCGVAASSLFCLYTNIKTLELCNVETFIVFRCSTCIVTSFGDWLFLGRELPHPHSILAVVGMVIGAASYATSDAAFRPAGYGWGALWYAGFCFNVLYNQARRRHRADALQLGARALHQPALRADAVRRRPTLHRLFRAGAAVA